MDMINNNESKRVKEDIIEMIKGIGVNDLSLLQEIESAIINIHADYYYTMLVTDALYNESKK